MGSVYEAQSHDYFNIFDNQIPFCYHDISLSITKIHSFDQNYNIILYCSHIL